METKLLWEREDVFDHYVASHPKGDVLQTTKWGRLKSLAGWTYWPLASLKAGVVQGVALILTRKLPLGLTLGYSPRGPLFSSREALDSLLLAGGKLLRKEKGLVWKMDPPILEGDPEWSDCVEAHNLLFIDRGLDFSGVQPRCVMTLDLSKPMDSLLKNMKSKTRYNIGYAQRKGVQIVRVKEKKLLNVFYVLLQETAIRDSFTIRPLEYFEAMWDHLVENNLAQLFLAYHDHTPLAGAICFRLPQRVWYVYGASSNEKRNLQASHLMQWEMIKWAKSLGARVYDFRGVSGDLREDNPLYGLYRFKEGFGAQLETYVGEFDLRLQQGGYVIWQGGLAIHNWMRKRSRPGSK